MARRLIRVTLAAALVLTAACGGRRGTEPPPPVPLPVMTLAGQRVAVFPATLVVASPDLGWSDAELGTREERLQRADSVLEAVLRDRVPEIDWVLPAALRDAAARAPGMVGNPDRMGTAALRNADLKIVPFPLVSEMRNLVAIAGDRYALVPAAIGYESAQGARVSARASLVIADLRSGQIRWRTLLVGQGSTPLNALAAALAELAAPMP